MKGNITSRQIAELKASQERPRTPDPKDMPHWTDPGIGTLIRNGKIVFRDPGPKWRDTGIMSRGRTDEKASKTGRPGGTVG